MVNITLDCGHFVAVSSLNPYKQKIYFSNILNGNLKTFKLSAKTIIDSSSDLEGEFFYLVVENFNLFVIPTIHVFHIQDSKIERSLIIEIPDFKFVSSIFSFYDYLLVFVKRKIIVMQKQDPSKFSVSHFCDLPFYGERVDFVEVFGSRWIAMVSRKEGCIVNEVTDIIKK